MKFDLIVRSPAQCQQDYASFSQLCQCFSVLWCKTTCCHSCSLPLSAAMPDCMVMLWWGYWVRSNSHSPVSKARIWIQFASSLWASSFPFPLNVTSCSNCKHFKPDPLKAAGELLLIAMVQDQGLVVLSLQIKIMVVSDFISLPISGINLLDTFMEVSSLREGRCPLQEHILWWNLFWDKIWIFFKFV